jgi:hypothetical protein
MKEQLRKTVELLKKQVKVNLEIIHKNEKLVKAMLNEPVSDGRSIRLENKYNINKVMLSENAEAIKLQLSIVKFLEKYGSITDDEGVLDEEVDEAGNLKEFSKTEESEKNKYSKDEYYIMTINDDIEFNNKHPYFSDNDFRKELLDYYIECEEYEKCKQIVNIEG